jgi:DNA repair protein RecN (Recombination protein N)
VNAVTGETGAGKTILAQAIGLLLGAKGDASYLGPGADEAYVEAELDLPEGILEDESFAAVAELRPEGEDELVVARRVFGDGRTRAYAWGRSVAREDLAALVEALVAMSGQFEQRRLARPAFQLDVLDAFAGDEQLRRRADLRRAWRELQAARRRHDEAAGAAAGHAARLEELRELVARTEGLEPGAEEALRSERERLRHVAELAEAATAAAESLAPESADLPGAAELADRAAAALDAVSALDPELRAVALELGEIGLRAREASSTLRAYLASLEAEPGRLEQVEEELDRMADSRRRFGAVSYDELLALAESARAELDATEGGEDPLETTGRALRAASARVDALSDDLSRARELASPAFASAVADALRGLGMGDGEFRAELSARDPGPAGRDEVSFLIRPNPGLPFAPAAETASGGELSRVALALRAAAHAGGGEPTVVFDEIDAGIGGRTAHAVAEALRRLGESTQVITITHLPQIASAADVHLRVEKIPGDPTHTRVARLSDDERREELERMLGGAEFLSTLR